MSVALGRPKQARTGTRSVEVAYDHRAGPPQAKLAPERAAWRLLMTTAPGRPKPARTAVRRTKVCP